MAAFVWRDGQASKSTPYMLLTTISVAALLFGTAPNELRLPYPLHVLVRFSDVPNIVFIWWLGRSLFDDDFRLGSMEWAGLAAYAGPVLIYRFNDIGFTLPTSPAIGWFTSLVALAMMAQLVWVALAGRSNDLVEGRRQVRVWFALGLAAACTIAVVAEDVTPIAFRPELSVLRSAVALPLAILGAFWLFSFEPGALKFQPPSPPEPAPEHKIDVRDHGLHAKLIQSIESEEIYKEAGLTISELANRIGAPEHHLRRLINQGLGFRNFSAFLNEYRLAAARAALEDVDRARDSVLTIAMEVGFNSLAPFNRAFKATFDTTPSAFRKKALSLIDPEKD